MRNRDFESLSPEKLAYPTIILDLFYLLTPFGKGREDEYDILEKVVRTFYDTSILRGSFLKGMLLESGIEELRMVPTHLSLEDLNNLWSTFGKPWKPSVAYIITPVPIPSTRDAVASQRVI